MTAKDYWKEKFGEYPKNYWEKLTVAIMQEYHQSEMIRQGFLVDEKTVYKLNEK